MARDVIDAVLGARGGAGAPERSPPIDGSSAPRTPTRSPASPRSWRRSRRSATVGPDAAARLVARHGTEAPAVVALGARAATCSDRSSPAGRSSRPRSPGPLATSWRCRSTTCSPGGRGWPRSSLIGARRSPRAWRRSSAPSSTGVRRARPARSRAYLESARREFSVAPSEAVGRPVAGAPFEAMAGPLGSASDPAD